MKSLFRKLFVFSNTEVTDTFASAQRVGKTRGLTLLHTYKEAAHGKLLIITPRSSGKAHERNLLRRRIKHIFYTNKFYEAQGYWILLVYQQAHRLSYQQLTQFLATAIQVPGYS